jgi:CRISPR-associated protein Cas1
MIAKEDKQKYLIERTIRRLEDYKQKIKLLEGEIVNDISATLRGWEGQSSKIYFETLNEFIPEKYRFENRTQRPAMDIANALLNYGYGIMYGRIEGDFLKSGIDPYIGVLHRDDYNRPVLAFDVIEIYRIWVDYVVFSLLSQNVITDEFFSVRSDGSYWLESLGRRIMIQSLNDYLEETVTVKGISRSRSTQIQLYAQSLAQKFKSFEK